MRKLYHFVPVLALCFGSSGALGEVLALEGKATISASGSPETAPFLVEGTVFQMRGEALRSFAKENGPGDYIVQVEGDFDIKSHKVAVTKLILKEKVRS
jgi:hypothetical protein